MASELQKGWRCLIDCQQEVCGEVQPQSWVRLQGGGRDEQGALRNTGKEGEQEGLSVTHEGACL